MKNKTIVRIFIFSIILVMIISITSVVFGGDPSISDFNGTKSNTANKIEQTGMKVTNLIQIVAMTVAVIMIIVLGIKYVTAAPEGKATVKKGMWFYLIGALFMFGTVGVIQIIKSFGNTAINGAK